MARVLIALADDFLSSEASLKTLLERRGHNVRLAAKQRTPINSKDGKAATPDLALYEINPDYFDFIIVGGEKIKEIITPELVTAIRKCAMKKGAAGINNGPIALAFAGVLGGKEATAPQNEKTIKFLRDSGAKYKATEIAVDGNILTAAYPEMIDEIFKQIIKLIEGR